MNGTLIEPGLKYRLTFDPALQNPVDGVVEVLRVGMVGPDLFATVSGRVQVPDDLLEDDEQPGLVEDEVWLTLVSRLGDVVRPTANGPCPACGGSGGRVDVEVDAQGVIRHTWHPCGRCGGTGVQR